MGIDAKSAQIWKSLKILYSSPYNKVSPGMVIGAAPVLPAATIKIIIIM